MQALHPCDPASPDYRDAKRRFDEIDREIMALAPDADPEPALGELIALGRSACFAIGGRLDLAKKATPHDGRPDSAYSLQAFWRDGGKDWIAGYLELGVSVAARGERFLSTQPTFHKTLSRETDPHSPLVPMLCSFRDKPCVAATAAFRERFESRLAVFMAGKLLAEWQARVRDSADARVPLDLNECLQAGEESKRRGLTHWVTCIRDYRESILSLPAPGIRRPMRGWLSISDQYPRDGTNCVEERVYDVVTGAAFKVRTCARLPVAPEGAVDGGPTERASSVEVEEGDVPPVLLSEAIWFLLQKDRVDLEAKAEGRGLPRDLDLSYDSDSSDRSTYGFGFVCGCSDCDGVSWKYALDGVVIKEGTTRSAPAPWCWSVDEEVEAYAANLLYVAEQQFAAGCALSAPPPGWKQLARRKTCKR